MGVTFWRSIRIGVEAICLGWVVIANGMYLVTLNDGVISNWLEHPSVVSVVGFMAFECLFVPAGLGCLAVDWWRTGRRGLGYLMGVASVYALFANSALLSLPYLGLYPNVPAAIAWWLLEVNEKSFYFATFFTNLILWPGMAWLIYGLAGRGRHDA